jgi:DNA-binding transcriptional MerR regulator
MLPAYKLGDVHYAHNWFATAPGKVPRNMELQSEVGDADRIAIGEFARAAGVTLRALRFYQSKGLLAPQCDGKSRVFSSLDRERLVMIQQGKRLGFTLSEISAMLAARERSGAKTLPISRTKCIEQIKMLESQRRELELALTELRQIHTGMFKDILLAAAEPAAQRA